jgi:tRNA pseudouridine32 synthase / 23S rRNA pseudouridine746 synthase
VSADLDELFLLPPCVDELQIVQRERDFLLVNKPTRLLSVPGRHPQNRDSVISRLLPEFPGAAIVHRLDFDTSGLMVVPLNKPALVHISKQFQARSIHKTYTAVVQGLVADERGVIDLAIAVDTDNRPKYKICALEGKPSVTEYEVLARDESAQTTRLMLQPITGRSHQLRLHMLALGHPILGCEFYADAISRAAAPRLLLHATSLTFTHPFSGQLVSMTCAAEF